MAYWAGHLYIYQSDLAIVAYGQVTYIIYIYQI